MPFRDYSEHDVLNLFAFGDDAVILLAQLTVVYAGSCSESQDWLV